VAAPRVRKVVFREAPGFHDEYVRFRELDANVGQALNDFVRAKAKIPPDQLPGKMRDHKLDGPLSQYKECHLASDVLLIYTHEKDTVTLYAVCTHKNIHGKAGKTMAKTLAGRRA
jgi:addiction module RelE/StbE family toxin